MNAVYYKVVVVLLVSNLPGAELIFTHLATPEPVLIDESMISNMLNEYKFHFLMDTSENRKKSFSKQCQTISIDASGGQI